ncbi:MAG: DUF2726 domain-containing protein [Lautropia sp.]|nr:DUF2726 domain-containing protein [Lautropia sp.]
MADPLSVLRQQLPEHTLYYLIGALLIFGIGFFLLGRPTREKPWRVKARPLLTDNETEFCHRLEDALPEFRILVQVSMGALIEPDLDDEEHVPPGRFLSIRGRFAQKVVDFVIVDDEYQVIALIELDDSTHDPDKDAKRDAITDMAGYLTLRYDSRQKPEPEEIRDDFIHAGLIEH